MDIVFAIATTVVDGHVIERGEHWLRSDPLVRLRPDLFTDDPSVGLSYSTPDAPVFEQATAAPGERRQVRRG